MNEFRLLISDRPGVLPKERMRHYFESAVTSTDSFASIFNLEQVITSDCRFLHYADQTTDIAWFGFAIGLRCAERIAKALSEPTPKSTATTKRTVRRSSKK